MATLSAAQIAAIVKHNIDNGAATSFTEAVPDVDTNGPIFVAIALAESGGNPAAIGGPNSNGTYDYGLWQINQRAHSDKVGELGPVGSSGKPEPTNPQWQNPDTNFNWANDLFQSRGNFRDWSSYNNQSYRTHLLAATSGWANPDNSVVQRNWVDNYIGAPIDAVVDTAEGLTGLVDALQNPQTWLRVMLIAGGGLVLLIGAWMVATQ